MPESPENRFLYYIALGSNKGDRAGFIRRAAKSLSAIGKILNRSAIYESEAYGVKDQPPFLNAVLCLQTGLLPHDLLMRIKSIENDLGRQKSYRWGPREIDLDILEYDGPAVDTGDLKIPHLELEKRLFVLEPLHDVAPDFTNRQNIAVQTLIGRCTDAGKINRLEIDW